MNDEEKISVPWDETPTTPSVLSGATRSFTVPVIKRGPTMGEALQQAINGMTTVVDGGLADFIDGRGRWVRVPRVTGGGDTPVMPPAWAQVAWAAMCDDLLLGEGANSDTIFARDLRDRGDGTLAATFHAVDSLMQEFCIPKKDAIPGMQDLIAVMLRQNPRRVRHGVRFADREFVRTLVDGQRTGALQELHPSDEGWLADPFELSFDCAWDEALAAEASTWCAWLTADAHSADNLSRFFATPLLEEYKHLTYVLYGEGGNGKGLIMNALMRGLATGALTASVDAARLLGGRGISAFEIGQEALKLAGALWAVDGEADQVELPQLTQLKRLSTGDPITARAIGENSVRITPRATFCLMTNNAVIMPSTEALRRRMACVRMRDGRKSADFHSFITWLHEHDAVGMVMASCRLWTQSSRPWDDVEIADCKNLTEWEETAVDAIVRDGLVPVGELPPVRSAERRGSMALLGLATAVRRIDGKSTKVIVVADSKKFAPYAAYSAAQQAEAAAGADSLRELLPAYMEAEGISTSGGGTRCAATVGELAAALHATPREVRDELAALAKAKKAGQVGVTRGDRETVGWLLLDGAAPVPTAADPATK